MSTGTKIIERALTHLGVNSPLKSVNSESVSQAMDTLNSMIASWQDEGIEMGAVPLKTPGQELSEPLGARNGIEFNLAILMAPDFPAAAISDLVLREANKGLRKIKNQWRPVTIPKKQIRSYPKGSGNKGFQEGAFFGEGEEIG